MDTDHVGQPRVNPDLVDDAQLAEIRGGWDRNGAYRQLHRRCVDYVLSYREYRSLLTAEDGEEIVSEAVLEELDAIVDSRVPAREIAARLKRALNRVRARHARLARRRSAS